MQARIPQSIFNYIEFQSSLTYLILINLKLQYLDSVWVADVHGLVADVEVEILHAPGDPSLSLVPHLGRLPDGYGTGHDELGLLVPSKAHLGVPEINSFQRLDRIGLRAKLTLCQHQ